MFNPTLRTVLLGSGAAVLMMAASLPATAGEIDDLKAQIQALQGKLNTIEARQDAAEVRGPVAPAAAVEAGDKPKSWKLPGTNTSMNIGGYAKLDFMYDLGPQMGTASALAGAPAPGNVACGASPGAGVAIPPSGTAADSCQDTFTTQAGQSRFWIKTWTPTDWGELGTHLEGDFVAGVYRLRHAYGYLGPVLAGQTWSNYLDLDSDSETIDFGGPAGDEAGRRQPQIRYTQSLGSGLTASVSIEDSNNVVLGNAAAAHDYLPDFAGKLQWKHSRGQVTLSGVVGEVALDSGSAGAGQFNGTTGLNASDSAVMWSAHIGGSYVITPMDTVGAYFNYGYGSDRYISAVYAGAGAHCSANFGGAFGCARAGTPASLVNIDTDNLFGGAAWYQHKWTDTIRSNFVYGYQAMDQGVNDGAAGATSSVHSVHANIIWSPVSQVNFGFEYIFGYANFNGGTVAGVNAAAAGDNTAHRFQIGMQYLF